MTVSFIHLSGTRENFDKVIDYNITTFWNSANTSSITPDIENGTDDPDYLARQDNTGPNKIFLNLISRERSDAERDDPNGDGNHVWKAIVSIDVYAETLAILGLFEDEINRILWEKAPNNSVRLVKSDASASEAHHFESSEIEFQRIEPQENLEVDDNPNSQGFLIIFYYKAKT